MIRAAAHYAWRLVVSRLKASATLATDALEMHTLPPHLRDEGRALLRRAHALNRDWHAWAERVNADAPAPESRQESLALRGAA